MDKVIVFKEDIPKLIVAFNAFPGETSIKDQAIAIQQILETDEDFIAIAWNQTSVNCDVWQPYNLNKQTEHWNLFETYVEDPETNQGENVQECDATGV